MCAIHGLFVLLVNGDNLTQTIHGCCHLFIQQQPNKIQCISALYEIIPTGNQTWNTSSSTATKNTPNTVAYTLWTMLVWAGITPSSWTKTNHALTGGRPAAGCSSLTAWVNCPMPYQLPPCAVDNTQSPPLPPSRQRHASTWLSLQTLTDVPDPLPATQLTFSDRPLLFRSFVSTNLRFFFLSSSQLGNC